MFNLEYPFCSIWCKSNFASYAAFLSKGAYAANVTYASKWIFQIEVLCCINFLLCYMSIKLHNLNI